MIASKFLAIGLLIVLLIATVLAQEPPPLTLTSFNLHASLSEENNENGKANPDDTIMVSWDNSAAGDNNPPESIVSVTVDVSVIELEWGSLALEDTGGWCDTAANDGIWTACLTVAQGSVDGLDLSFTVTVINTPEEVAQAATSETIFVDNKIPELVSARTISPAYIEVLFSEPIDPEALEADGTDFALQDGEHAITAASADGSLVTLIISPDMPTDFSSSLTVGWGTTIQDLAGNILYEGFVDVADGMAPLFVSARTLSAYELEVFFGEAIADDDLWIEDLLVDDFSIGNLFLDEFDGARLRIDLEDPMPTGATPTISIYEDGNGVPDWSGNTQYAGSIVAADGIAPEVVSVQATTPTTITVTFSEDLDDSVLVADDFVVYRTMVYDEELGYDVPADPLLLLSLGELDGVVTLTFEEPLQAGDKPQVELHPGEETTLQDLAGNAYEQPNEIHTVQDAMPPIIIVDRTVVLAQAGEEVPFSAEASDVFSGLEGDPWWDFGDGSIGENGLVVSHAFETGTYEVTVQATDDEQEATVTIIVVVGDSPVTLEEAPDVRFAFTEIPAGSFELTAEEKNVTNISTASFVVGSNFYDITSDLSNGEFTVTLMFTYKDLDNDGIVDGTTINEQELGVYYHDGSSWVAIPDPVRDTEANAISVTVNHFTLFTLLTPEPPTPQSNNAVPTGGGGRRSSGAVVPAVKPPLVSTPSPALPAERIEEEEPTVTTTTEAGAILPLEEVAPIATDGITGAAAIDTSKSTSGYWAAGILAVVAVLLGVLIFFRRGKGKTPLKSSK